MASLCLALGCSGDDSGRGDDPGPEVSPEDVRAWAKEVILGSEFGDQVPVCTRWTKSPTLSVIAGEPDELADLDAALAAINSELEPIGLPVQVVPPGDTTADIEVHFVPLDEFDAIARANGFEYVPGNDGYFWIFWDSSFRLDKSYVLLASDLLRGDVRRHFVAEEVTQSLGPANDSSIFLDSVFFQQGAFGGLAPRLSELDLKLLRFMYTELEPGDREPELDAAFDRTWPW